MGHQTSAAIRRRKQRSNVVAIDEHGRVFAHLKSGGVVATLASKPVRGNDAHPWLDRDEVLRALLEACAFALADDGDRLAWAAAAALRNLDVRGTQAHVRNLARTYARARLAQACEVWER
jgi:hypothetical protein